MSSTLAKAAAKAAGTAQPAAPDLLTDDAAEWPEPTSPAAEPVVEPSPEVVAYEEATGTDDPPQVPVILAWNRVMKDVRAIAKASQVESGPARFWYRGVDAAMEAFGPACRRHGVLVIPERVEPAHAPTTTSNNKAARECTVLITYRIYGPAGDSITAQAAGESVDTGDKATAKAQAVALRTLLYHAGLVPTRDTDPDAHNIERGEAPVRTAADYRDEVLNPRTRKSRLYQIHHELKSTGRLGEMVVNENGDDETIGDLVVRVGSTRA